MGGYSVHYIRLVSHCRFVCQGKFSAIRDGQLCIIMPLNASWRLHEADLPRSGTDFIHRAIAGVMIAQPWTGRLAAQSTSHQSSSSGLTGETPAKFEPATQSFDYTRREVMIPMRDGVRLHTVILVPKGAKRAPILLTRTPYDANVFTSHAASSHLGPILQGYDNATELIVEGAYIRVVQDVRGRYGSEAIM